MKEVMLAELGLGDGEVADAVAMALEAQADAGRLNVAGNRVGVAGIVALTERVRGLAVKPPLRVLHLGMNAGLGDEGVRAVCAWVSEPGGIGERLEALSLAGCGVGDAGTAAVAEMLSMGGEVPPLRVVDLSMNAIGDEGAVRLAQALPRLRALFLNGNAIGNRGGRVLALGLLDAPGVMRLNVQGNVFGDAVAQLFETTWLDRSEFLVLPEPAPAVPAEAEDPEEDSDDGWEVDAEGDEEEKPV